MLSWTAQRTLRSVQSGCSASWRPLRATTRQLSQLRQQPNRPPLCPPLRGERANTVVLENGVPHPSWFQSRRSAQQPPAPGGACQEPEAALAHLVAPAPPPAVACRSPASSSRRGLLAAAQRLALQAANLEEEAKRREATAFYCIREAEQLDGAHTGCYAGITVCCGWDLAEGTQRCVARGTVPLRPMGTGAWGPETRSCCPSGCKAGPPVSNSHPNCSAVCSEEGAGSWPGGRREAGWEALAGNNSKSAAVRHEARGQDSRVSLPAVHPSRERVVSLWCACSWMRLLMILWPPLVPSWRRPGGCTRQAVMTT